MTVNSWTPTDKENPLLKPGDVLACVSVCAACWCVHLAISVLIRDRLTATKKKKGKVKGINPLHLWPWWQPLKARNCLLFLAFPFSHPNPETGSERIGEKLSHNKCFFSATLEANERQPLSYSTNLWEPRRLKTGLSRLHSAWGSSSRWDEEFLSYHSRSFPNWFVSYFGKGGGGSDSLIAEKRTTQGGHFISRVWRRILWGGLLKGRRQKATVTAQTDTRSHTIHKTRLMTKSRCPCKVACKKFHTNYSVIIKTCQWCCVQWSRMGCLRGTVVTPDKAAVCRAQLMGKEGWRWDEMILSRRSIFSVAGGGTHGGKGTRRERREVRRKIVVLLLRKDLRVREWMNRTPLALQLHGNYKSSPWYIVFLSSRVIVMQISPY